MRVGFFQFEVVFADKPTNLQKVHASLSGCDLDLVVLPELFTSGSILTSREQAYGFAESVPDGETTRMLMAIAETSNISIIGGLIEREGDRLYNTVVIVSPQGFVGKHRKVHLSLFDTGFFTPGDTFRAFDLPGVRIGILLCYDSWFPDAGKALARQGVSLICNPSNFCGEDSLEVIRHRALESSAYTVTANRLGMDHDTGTDVSFIGASQIVNPEGVVIHRAGDQEILGVEDITF